MWKCCLIHVSILSFLKVCLHKFKVHAMCPLASKLSLLCGNLLMNLFQSLYKMYVIVKTIFKNHSFVAVSEFDVCSELDDKVCFISDFN